MTNRTRRDPRQLQREKLLFRYTSALERGDFDTVANVLQEAQRDASLAAMLNDLDEALAAELPVIRASSNHRKPIPETRSPIANRQGQTVRTRPVYPYTLAAAIVVVALFAGILLFDRPTTRTETVTPASIAQNPEPTGTPFPVETPTHIRVGSEVPVPTQIGQPMILCDGLVNPSDGANLFIAPDPNARLITRLPSGAMLQIIDMGYSPEDTIVSPVWFQVNALMESGNLVGWMNESTISLLTNCPEISNSLEIFLPTPISPVIINDANRIEQYVLAEDVGQIPAGMPLTVTSGYFDGETWRYEVQVIEGQVEEVSLGQILQLIDEEPITVMGSCILTVGSRQARLFLAPDPASQILIAIEPESELVATVITNVIMPDGANWLLVSLDSSPSISGWLNRDDLRNRQIACSPLMSSAYMMPMGFGALPVMPSEIGPLAAPQMQPPTVTPDVPMDTTDTVSYTPTWTPTP